MSKYNTPGDFDVLNQIRVLQRRIEDLERVSRPSSVVVTSPFTSAQWNTLAAVTSGTFTTTHLFPIVHTAPTPVVTLMAFCSDGSTAGEFRLTDAQGNALTGPGGVAVPPTPIPLGTTADTVFKNNQVPNYWYDLPIGTDQWALLQVRRTAGAGTVNVRAKYLTQEAS